LNRRVIFVNRYFYPDHSATSQLLTDLTFFLVTQNFEIHVITSRQLIDDPGARLRAHEIIQGVQVQRIATTSFGRSNLIGRAIDYLSFYFSAVIALLKTTRQHDIIVAKSDPPLVSVFAAAVAWYREAILINWLQDLFPEVAGALGIKAIKPLVPMLAFVRNHSLLFAKANIVLGERMAEIVKYQTNAKANTLVIHNWSDGDKVRPTRHNQNSLRCTWGLKDKFVVGYSGNMGRAHEFDTILDAAEVLKNESDIVFLFIGNGAKRNWIQAQTKSRSLANIIFKPYQQRNQLSESLGCADIHLISLIPELEGLIVPSKFYGIAAAGRGVLFVGDLEGEIARIVMDNQCGYSINIDNSTDLAKSIGWLSKHRLQCSNLGKRARILFDDHYNISVALGKMKTLLENVDTFD